MLDKSSSEPDANSAILPYRASQETTWVSDPANPVETQSGSIGEGELIWLLEPPLAVDQAGRRPGLDWPGLDWLACVTVRCALFSRIILTKPRLKRGASLTSRFTHFLAHR